MEQLEFGRVRLHMDVDALFARLPRKYLRAIELVRLARVAHIVVAHVRHICGLLLVSERVVAHRPRLGVVVGRGWVQIEQVFGCVLSHAQVAHADSLLAFFSHLFGGKLQFEWA